MPGPDPPETDACSKLCGAAKRDEFLLRRRRDGAKAGCGAQRRPRLSDGAEAQCSIPKADIEIASEVTRACPGAPWSERP